MKNQIAIKAQNISFTYPLGGFSKEKTLGRRVIKELTLEIEDGASVALIGPNGSGKTTLGKLLAGILKPDQGRIHIYGQDTSDIPLYEIGKKLGYVFQNPQRQLFTSTVEEEISMGLVCQGLTKNQAKERAEELMALFQLEKQRNSFPLNLSYGEKRRLATAAALALSPKFIILDEPTVGLDSEKIKILTATLKKLQKDGKGMLIISHNEEFIRENAHRLLRMDRGRLVHDGSAD